MIYKVTTCDYESIFTNGKYKYVYKPGHVMETYSTLGFMLFEELKHVNIFISICNRILYPRLKPLTVLSVCGLGEKTIPPYVSSRLEEEFIDRFYRFYNLSQNLVRTVKPPFGTICYHKLKVLQEVERDDW